MQAGRGYIHVYSNAAGARKRRRKKPALAPPRRLRNQRWINSRRKLGLNGRIASSRASGAARSPCDVYHVCSLEQRNVVAQKVRCYNSREPKIVTMGSGTAHQATLARPR